MTPEEYLQAQLAAAQTNICTLLSGALVAAKTIADLEAKVVEMEKSMALARAEG